LIKKNTISFDSPVVKNYIHTSRSLLLTLHSFSCTEYCYLLLN